MTPDQVAELEEERRFLLRSLTDLEREHEAGDVDDHDFEVLRDGYTARAATVLRALEADAEVRRTRPTRRHAVTAAWVVGVVLIAGLAGWLVATSSGERNPGQTMTGGAPVDEVTQKLSQAFAADPSTAFRLYQEVLAVEPDHPEARTYLAWLVARSSRGGDTDSDTAAAGLDAAVELLTEVTIDTPDYTDAHCLLAVVAARYLPEPDVELALREGEICMSTGPTTLNAQLVGPLLEELRSAADSTPSPG